MQISLNIQDDIYQKLVNANVDMQSKINDYLIKLVATDEYINSDPFNKDKAYFHQALKDIENGKTELLTQEEYDKEMKFFEKSLL